MRSFTPCLPPMELSESGLVPPGFSLAQTRGKFTTHNGPVYRADGAGDVRSGIRILDRHCNGMGFLHGGMAAAFSDSALAWAVWDATGRMSVTLKLTMAYLDVVREGEWLEARPQVDGVHDGMVHVHARLIAGDGVCEGRAAGRADAVFRLLRRRPS